METDDGEQKLKFKIPVKLGLPKYCPNSTRHVDMDPAKDFWIEIERSPVKGTVYSITGNNFTSRVAHAIGAVSWKGPEILYHGCSSMEVDHRSGEYKYDTNVDVWEIFKIASVLHSAEEMLKINFLNNTIQFYYAPDDTNSHIKSIREAFKHMTLCSYDPLDV